MSLMGAFSRSQIGEGGAENNRFASKAPNALTFFLSDGFIEKVRHLPAPPRSLTQTEISRLIANNPDCVCDAGPAPPGKNGKTRSKRLKREPSLANIR